MLKTWFFLSLVAIAGNFATAIVTLCFMGAGVIPMSGPPAWLWLWQGVAVGSAFVSGAALLVRALLNDRQ